MAAPGALSVAHDPARTRAPAAARDAIARPGRVRVPAGRARVARDGADVVRHGPTRNRTENLLIKRFPSCWQELALTSYTDWYNLCHQRRPTRPITHQ